MAKLLTTAAAALVAVASGADDLFKVGGACDVDGGIDGLTFAKQGVTMSGAPYFKAQNKEVYLYWDPDCQSGSADPVARWIFDTQKPDLEKQDDLDNDQACDFLAHIDSDDQSKPPSQRTWKVHCEDVEEQHYLTFRDPVQTTRKPYMASATPSTLVSGSQRLQWDGACPTKSFVAGLVFEEVGTTSDGRPFYKAKDNEVYIYFDMDCDGTGTTVGSRWILDNDRPIALAVRDLDQDGKCDYHARLESVSQRPPATANWRMYCGSQGWVDVPVTLTDKTTTKMLNSAHKGGSCLAAAALVAAGAVVLGF